MLAASPTDCDVEGSPKTCHFGVKGLWPAQWAALGVIPGVIIKPYVAITGEAFLDAWLLLLLSLCGNLSHAVFREKDQSAYRRSSATTLAKG